MLDRSGGGRKSHHRLIPSYKEPRSHFPPGRDVETSEGVAIKLEHYIVDSSLLDEEARIYQSLAGHSEFPQVHWYGSFHDFTIVVFDLLGPNLEDLLRYRHFPPRKRQELYFATRSPPLKQRLARTTKRKMGNARMLSGFTHGLAPPL